MVESPTPCTRRFDSLFKERWMGVARRFLRLEVLFQRPNGQNNCRWVLLDPPKVVKSNIWFAIKVMARWALVDNVLQIWWMDESHCPNNVTQRTIWTCCAMRGQKRSNSEPEDCGGGFSKMVFKDAIGCAFNFFLVWLSNVSKFSTIPCLYFLRNVFVSEDKA